MTFYLEPCPKHVSISPNLQMQYRLSSFLREKRKDNKSTKLVLNVCLKQNFEGPISHFFKGVNCNFPLLTA